MKENENVMNGLTASQMVKAVLVTPVSCVPLPEYPDWCSELLFQPGPGGPGGSGAVLLGGPV